MALSELLAANQQYAAAFDAPRPLGVRRSVSVITCMDSRLLVERMLGLELGDAEIIRNAGGRPRDCDVVRSLFVAQEVPELAAREAVERHWDFLMGRMRQLLADYMWPLGVLAEVVRAWSGLVLPRPLRRLALSAATRHFSDPAASVRRDASLLRAAPLFPKDIPIHGLVYDVATGALEHVITSPGRGGGAADWKR
ncbi:hypothetical protein Rsub_09256 [Raphidocelis subcapitata]|uniref:Carbonic anhydrase n=1 Tax=Raphidocelis subcapitata TaxID=307507 RepID=A0A2V0PGX5_9CHLO|nr:hypothetical protein Rsub_09256 [Raphidocelis subcapitata]|eukprot:GBF96457.1 hypothetical protein Rsub_09256 [Raphidocelis subcapitata]